MSVVSAHSETLFVAVDCAEDIARTPIPMDDSRFSYFSHQSVCDSRSSSNTEIFSNSATSESDSKARAIHRAQELFVEACGALYNDILDAADLDQEVPEEVFRVRQMEIVSQGAQLSDAVPQLSNMISHKLSTVNRAMEHLKIRRNSPPEGCTKDDREISAITQLRKWIQSTNEKLAKIESSFSKDTTIRKKLDRLAADQQLLQLQIETEGQTLVQNVERSLIRRAEENNNQNWDCRTTRRQQHLKVLTQRWHDLWLRSLSVQFRIEKQIEGNFQSEQDWESDPELSEPLTKRRRVVEGSTITEASSDDPLRSEEDTIPFAEDEYESIVDSVTMIQTQTRMLDGTSPLPANESSEKEELEPQPDIGYSSGENSIHEALNEVAGLTTLSTTALTVNESNQENMIIASDFERNGCIEITSPVKSFYRTVPLDDAGVTDTETPRICVTKWSSKFINATNNMDDNNNNNDNVLTDSLIVNTEDETDIVTGNDIKEIMSMLDDDENGNLQSSQFQQQIDVLKQGTRWRELRSTQTPSRRHSHKATSHDNSIVGDDKNSCDASSEESDDGCDNIAIISNPVSESQCNSLKRPHRTRNHHPSSYIFSNAYQTLFNSSTGTINKEMDTSMLSTYSSQAQSDLMSTSEILSSNPFAYSHIVTSSSIRTRRSARRKLRARRLPRSMSDGEQLGTSMNASTYSAPPATNPSYHCRTPLRDSDTTTTAPEHSDAQTYEWDEYNPPAKIEDGWMGYDEERQDASALTLADDDFQMYLGDDVSSLIAESRASLRSAQSLINRQPSRQSLEDLRTLAKANSERLTATVVANPRLRMESLNDIDDVNKGWSAVLSTIDSLSTSECCDDKTVLSTSDTTPVDSTYSGCADDSPLPRILSKIEKFASSLKLIQEDNDCSASSLGSLSSIRSFDDVVNAIKIFTEIHSRLVEEREELRCLLNSSTFSGDLSYLVADFEPLSMGYEEAIVRVEQLMNQIEKVRESWSDWADTQNNLQIVMSGIEQELNELRKGDDNSKQICSELEMCQERMNRLETVCNYLTSNLSILHDNSTSNAPALNFTSELAVYSNALGQLKARFEETLRSTLMCDKATWINDAAIAGTNQKSDRLPRRRLKTAESGTNTIPTAQTRIFDVILGNWAFQAFVLLAVMAAFAAWLISIDNRLTNNWRSSVGPHLDYIDGPPPM